MAITYPESSYLSKELDFRIREMLGEIQWLIFMLQWLSDSCLERNQPNNAATYRSLWEALSKKISQLEPQPEFKPYLDDFKSIVDAKESAMNHALDVSRDSIEEELQWVIEVVANVCIVASNEGKLNILYKLLEEDGLLRQALKTKLSYRLQVASSDTSQAVFIPNRQNNVSDGIKFKGLDPFVRRGTDHWCPTRWYVTEGEIMFLQPGTRLEESVEVSLGFEGPKGLKGIMYPFKDPNLLSALDEVADNLLNRIRKANGLPEADGWGTWNIH